MSLSLSSPAASEFYRTISVTMIESTITKVTNHAHETTIASEQLHIGTNARCGDTLPVFPTNPPSEIKKASAVEERARNEEQQQDLGEKIRVPRENDHDTVKN